MIYLQLLIIVLLGLVIRQQHNIKRKQNEMATDQKTFDAKLSAFLADLNAQIKIIDDSVQSIIDKNAASNTPLDLSDEAAQLDAATSKLDSISGGLPTIPTSVPSPTPEPAPAQPAVSVVPPSA